MKEQFNNESLKKNQIVILKIKGSINQIKKTQIFIYRLIDQIVKDYLDLKKCHYIQIILKKKWNEHNGPARWSEGKDT